MPHCHTPYPTFAGVSQKEMYFVPLVLITYVLALLCPLVCVGYLCAVDPDVVIYRHVNATDSNTGSGNDTDTCFLAGVCDNGAALCAQGNEVVLGSECDPTGFWTALLLLKWVYIFVWLTRLPFLFTSVMRVVGKEGKVTAPDALVDNCTVVSQLASFVAFVIMVGAHWERNPGGTYFPTGFPYLLWYVMKLDFVMSMMLPLSGFDLYNDYVPWTWVMVLSLSFIFSFISLDCGTDSFYLPFALITVGAPSVWYHTLLIRNLWELLAVGSFFAWTALYYALEMGDRDITYFMSCHDNFKMLARMGLFSMALSSAFAFQFKHRSCKPITWEGVCAMPHEQAAAVTHVMSAIHAEWEAREKKCRKDPRTLEALPQDTLHTVLHGATVGEMCTILGHFCETRNGFSIIVASRVLINRNDLLVDVFISPATKYRLLKACDDEALSTHVLDKIPIAELCEAINDVETNPDEALDYVEKFVCVEELITECKLQHAWHYMMPFVWWDVPTLTCALIARGYKGLFPQRRLYIAAAVMWMCVYLAGLVVSIYVCATLGLEEDTDGSMPLFLVFLVPAGVLVSYDVVSPPLRHALCARLTKRAANNSSFVEMNARRRDSTSTQSTDSAKVAKSQSADDGADVTVQLEEVDVEGADDV